VQCNDNVKFKKPVLFQRRFSSLVRYIFLFLGVISNERSQRWVEWYWHIFFFKNGCFMWR